MERTERGRLLTVRAYWHFIRLAWRASRVLSMVVVAAVAVASVAPLAAIAAVGAVVGQISAVAAEGLGSPAGRAAQWWVVAAGLFLLLQWAAGALQTWAAKALGERIDATAQRDLMAAAMMPVGIRHLEDPRTLDLINVGRETFRANWARPGRMAMAVSGLVSGRLMMVGSCLIVARFHPLLGLALLAVGVWAVHEDKAASRTEAAHHYGGTELARRTEFYYELGVTPPAAKEVRIFGLAGFLSDRFSATWRRAMTDVIVPASPRPLVAAAALGTVVVLGIVWVAWRAMAGDIGVGQATIYAMALMASLTGMQQSSWTGVQTELALATLRRYREAVAATAAPGPAAITVSRPAERLPREEIRFEQVSFSYPGEDVDVVDELDLVIPAGRSLAIVGVNGAGKTTLVKLLCRLYEPVAGRITVDGIDLASLDVVGWRRRLAAVFQDATRFELTAANNVEFGRADAAGDRDGVEAAGASAGVADIVAGLPLGWDTPLSSQYAGGVDLSGGEWQKVALARALFAIAGGARVLILDEPAAHLDARAEAELYQRFLAMTQGLTTIVISHRFSTVRQASSIVVLDGGGVVEQGSHSELMARGGRYAEMFQLQASRFADVGEQREQVVTDS